MLKKYSLGLDIGTSSVGWAVIDENYSLHKWKGKNMWGTRLFEEATTAAERRISRGARRRYDRRKHRLNLLQQLIGEEVLKEDPEFFIRMKESFLIKEDKTTIRNDILNIKDKKLKKSIYHVRNHLMTTPEKEDIRLVYLAIHHIIKYRGNFLFEGQTFNFETQEIKDNIIQVLSAYSEYIIDDWQEKVEQVSNILSNFKETKMQRCDNICELLSKKDKTSKQIVDSIFKAILNYKFSYKKLFGYEEDISLSFSDMKDGYDDSGIENDEDSIILGNLYKIYSWVSINDILASDDGKGQSVSASKIRIYDEHAKDLKCLKDLFKTYLEKDDYFDFFKKAVKYQKDAYLNYVSYIKFPQNSEKLDLYKTIDSLFANISGIEDDENYQYYLKRKEEGKFLKKLNSKENSLIPYQLNKIELIQILENQGKHYPILLENKDKIISLLEFKIPYYVGPLNSSSSFAWLERKESGKIYPWNFEQKVDIDFSAEKFIKRMTNKCTYLLQNDVIPKNSLLYSEYEVLNELNKIRINGRLLDVTVKNRIANELFCQQLNIKATTLKKWLENNGYYRKDEIEAIDGFQKDNEFASNRQAYIKFKNIFGSVDKTNIEMIEKLILWLTLFTDKNILKRKIADNFPAIPQNSVGKIINLTFTGWGRLSRELLDGVLSESGTTIIQELRNTTQNFMQLINDENLGFKKAIEKVNIAKESVFLEYSDVQELQGSPAIKRGIWQTILIIKEIEKIMKGKPEKIYIEFARSEEDKKRTVSKGNKINDIYKTILNNEFLSKEVKKQASGYKKSITDKRIALYFMQCGRCMYSGEALEFSMLSTYEIDHIIPRSYIKDDSLDNLVLVKKLENQFKSNDLCISLQTQQKQGAFWKYLKDKKLISDKKYFNLTRKEFSEKQLEGFIARQLVETRQITKHLVTLLMNYYTNDKTSIYAMKASLISDLRQQYNLYKIRELNDYHHANDAYLVAVVGNYINNRFVTKEKDFKYGEFIKYAKNQNKQNQNKYAYIINSMKNDYVDEMGTVIWHADAAIAAIKNAMAYKDCFISRKVEEVSGSFYKITILPADKSDSLAMGKRRMYQSQMKLSTKASYPIKQHLPTSVYGGYAGENKAYYCIIEYDVVGAKSTKQKKELIGISVQASKCIKNKQDLLLHVQTMDKKYVNVRILKEKIMKYQMIEVDGNLLYLTSDSEVINARQLIIDKKYTPLLYKISKKYIDDTSIDENESLNQFYDYFIEKMKTYYPIYAGLISKLELKREDFYNASISNKSGFILELLKITQANASNAKLDVYGLAGFSAREGRKKGFSMKPENTVFITHSVTGMFETRYKV